MSLETGETRRAHCGRQRQQPASRGRWNQELDLRDTKVTLQMDVLRGQTPELVRKEIWTHILACNLIRTVMAQAASRHGILPRTISFKGTLQTVEAFQPLIGFQSDRSATACRQLYCHLLDAVASHRVADRPDRFEPRVTKRRQREEIGCSPRDGNSIVKWRNGLAITKRLTNNWLGKLGRPGEVALTMRLFVGL